MVEGGALQIESRSKIVTDKVRVQRLPGRNESVRDEDTNQYQRHRNYEPALQLLQDSTPGDGISAGSTAKERIIKASE